MTAKSIIAQTNEIAGLPLRKTATMELSAFEWKIIVLALREADTLPKSSGELADEIAELVTVQIQENIN